MKRFIVFILFVIALPLYVYSQKEVISEKEKVIERAKKELDASVAGGELKEFASLNQITGEYIFDITIYEKGKVLTVYVVSSDADDMKKQNLLKSKVREFLFNFKMPKGKNYKFQYTFNF